MGSIGVGITLGWLAYYLGCRNLAMLNGQAIPPAQLQQLEQILKDDPVGDRAYVLR